MISSKLQKNKFMRILNLNNQKRIWLKVILIRQTKKLKKQKYYQNEKEKKEINFYSRELNLREKLIKVDKNSENRFLNMKNKWKK